MASILRRLRRNVSTREALRVRGAYITRRIDVNQRDEMLATLVPPPRPIRFARVLAASFGGMLGR